MYKGEEEFQGSWWGCGVWGVRTERHGREMVLGGVVVGRGEGLEMRLNRQAGPLVIRSFYLEAFKGYLSKAVINPIGVFGHSLQQYRGLISGGCTEPAVGIQMGYKEDPHQDSGKDPSGLTCCCGDDSYTHGKQ